MRKQKKLARATQATEYDVFYNFENLSPQVRHLLRCRNSIVSQSNEWNYGGFTCVLFLHEHVRSDNSSYPKLKQQEFILILDRACFSWCFFEIGIQPCFGWKHPNTLLPHIPWLPIHLHHSKAIHPAAAGLLSKKYRNTENSTTLADMKNVKNIEK